MTEQSHHSGNPWQPDPNANAPMPSEVWDRWPSSPTWEPIRPSPQPSGARPIPEQAIGPEPSPTRRGYDNQQRDWQEEREDRARQREQERDARLHWRNLQREVFQLQQQLRRLDAEESVISAQLAALPQPASPITRLILACVVVAAILAALAFYPILLVPLIVVLLIVAKAGRHARVLARQRRAWAEQERFRLESRWSGIVAERAAMQAQLKAIQAQLTVLFQP